jgi:Protein of unknown function (DUF2878)
VSFWANLIGYQVAWFITVIGAGHGYTWPGVLATTSFCAANIAMSRERLLDLKLIGLALLFGLVSDGSLATVNFLGYAPAHPSIPTSTGAPLWILSLWCAFAVTLNRSLKWLQQRPPAAAAFGALGGPLAYSGAARGWGAVEFVAPAWRAEIWLAVSWATALYVFARVIRGVSSK